MATTSMFIVQNGDFLMYFLGFIVFVFVAVAITKIIFTTLNAKKGLKITGKIK